MRWLKPICSPRRHAAARSICTIGDNDLFERGAAVPYDAFALAHERRPVRGEQSQTVFGETQGGPRDRVREPFVHKGPQDRIGVDPRAFAPHVGDHAFAGPADAFRLNVPVVRGQENVETAIE